MSARHRRPGPALAPLALLQKILLVVVEHRLRNARIAFLRRRLVRAEVAAVPLAALDEVDVLQICGDRFDRIHKVPEHAQVGRDPLLRCRFFEICRKEQVAYVSQACQLPLAVRRIRQVCREVLIFSVNVGRAPRDGDDVPAAGLNQMLQQVPSHHTGCTGYQCHSAAHNPVFQFDRLANIELHRPAAIFTQGPGISIARTSNATATGTCLHLWIVQRHCAVRPVRLPEPDPSKFTP